MEKTYTISAQYGYIVGRIRYGHIEMALSESDYKEFLNLTPEEQKNWLKDEGEIIIDDFDIEDLGSLDNIEIIEN